MDLNTLPSNTTDCTMSVSINFGPKLEPLHYTAYTNELAVRCNELLAKIEIIESLLNNLAANHR